MQRSRTSSLLQRLARLSLAARRADGGRGGDDGGRGPRRGHGTFFPLPDEFPGVALQVGQQVLETPSRAIQVLESASDSRVVFGIVACQDDRKRLELRQPGVALLQQLVERRLFLLQQ